MVSIVIQRGLALLGVIFLLPLLLVVALLIFLFDGWPVLFVQERVGLNGVIFRLYKFRSMTVENNSRKATFDAGSNRRVTRFGAFLRKSKIDELPQLFNVLKGNMLIVGPRPEIKKWVDVYPHRWETVHSIYPGITDPASILYRNEEILLSQADDPEKAYKDEILPHKLDLYEQYVSNRTGIGDFKIAVKTIVAIFQ